MEILGAPNGIRTRVTAVRGRCPRPLDDGDIGGAKFNSLRPVRLQESNRAGAVSCSGALNCGGFGVRGNPPRFTLVGYTMLLTTIPLDDLPTAVARFGACLGEETRVQQVAQRVLQRATAGMADLTPDSPALSEDPEHHRQAVELLARFGMAAVHEPPSQGFTWDGHAVWVGMEPSVIIHEVAHYQVSAPDRRALIDFGLGAGPETGLKAEANAVQRVVGLAGEVEETLASLLGVLWEAELGQPAILAFLEQNWLEGGASEANRRHYLKIVGHLLAHGFIDHEGRPTTHLRDCSDADFIEPLLIV